MLKGVPHTLQCRLDERVQLLVRTICDLSVLNDEMHQANIKQSYLPLGSITSDRLKHAFDVLLKIRKLLVCVFSLSLCAYVCKCASK